jgi:immune inhibitor A
MRIRLDCVFGGGELGIGCVATTSRPRDGIGLICWSHRLGACIGRRCKANPQTSKEVTMANTEVHSGIHPAHDGCTEQKAADREMRFLVELDSIYRANRLSDDGTRCCVAPAPVLRDRIRAALAQMRQVAPPGMAHLAAFKHTPRVGFNDGLLVPGSLLPAGTPPAVARNMALERAPLRGVVNVVVVLVEFTDRAFSAQHTRQHFEDLFFSTGVIATGSVREYYAEATNNLVTISGQVVGPYTMPRTLAEYANGASGTGSTNPNARDLARDAAQAADADVDFSGFDNDGDGFVDAYVIVHAGAGAEQSGSGGDIWSHKWVLRSALDADGVQIYAYLTVPEDALIGVCAHELGHLLFGFPDLYDTDGTSEGVGNWCLMGGGSWNGGGATPAHPSAWCKANQGWATVTNVSSNGVRSIQDVREGHEVFRLWKDGGVSQEYFLVENRQKTGFDAELPGSGLCIWHIDESISTNSNEAHPKVALEQADGLDHLGSGANRGDAGDAWPGSTNKTAFDRSSTPNSRSYAGNDTCVAVTSISASGTTMTADLRVACGKEIGKEFADKRLDKRIEKRRDKLFTDKSFDKLRIADKRPEKPDIDKRVGFDKGFDFDQRARSQQAGDAMRELESRLSALESAMAELEPFIDAALRPDLGNAALRSEQDLQRLRAQMEAEGMSDKRYMDSPPRNR